MTGRSAETLSALLPLVAIIPLLLAGVAAVIPWAPVRVALSLATPALMAATAFALLYRVMDSGPIGHNVGGFPGGVSIPFVADAFSLLMLGVAALGRDDDTRIHEDREANAQLSTAGRKARRLRPADAGSGAGSIRHGEYPPESPQDGDR